MIAYVYCKSCGKPIALHSLEDIIKDSIKYNTDLMEEGKTTICKHCGSSNRYFSEDIGIETSKYMDIGGMLIGGFVGMFLGPLGLLAGAVVGYLVGYNEQKKEERIKEMFESMFKGKEKENRLKHEKIKTDIIEYFKENHERYIYKKEIAEAIGIEEKSAIAILDDLVDEGKLTVRVSKDDFEYRLYHPDKK